MKTFIMSLLFAAFASTGLAQCDKEVVLKFNRLTESKVLQAGTPQQIEASINFSKDRIIITAMMGGSAKTIESNVKKVIFCSWKSFLKDGRAEYQTESRKGTEGPFDPSSISLESVNSLTKVIFTPPSADGTFIQFDIVNTASGN
jgi:hypothetical protein